MIKCRFIAAWATEWLVLIIKGSIHIFLFHEEIDPYSVGINTAFQCTLLPTTYEVSGKAMFSLLYVILFTRGGGADADAPPRAR